MLYLLMRPFPHVITALRGPTPSYVFSCLFTLCDYFIMSCDHLLVSCDCLLMSRDCLLMSHDCLLMSCDHLLVSRDCLIMSCDHLLMSCDHLLMSRDCLLVSRRQMCVQCTEDLIASGSADSYVRLWNYTGMCVDHSTYMHIHNVHMYPHTCTLTHVPSHMYPHTCTLTHVPSHMYPHTCPRTSSLTHVSLTFRYLLPHSDGSYRICQVPTFPWQHACIRWGHEEDHSVGQ